MSITLPTTPAGYSLGKFPAGVTGVEYNGNQYLFAHQFGNYGAVGDNKIHILKSTDSGLTWSDIGSFSSGTDPGYATCQDGSTAWIVYCDSVGPNPLGTACGTLYTRSLDMSSDTLSGANTQSLIVHHTSGGPSCALSLNKLSTGTLILTYSSEPLPTDNWRTSIATMSGSNFGSGTELPGQSGTTTGLVAAAADDSGVLHILYTVSGGILKYVGYNGSFGSPVTVADIWDFASNVLCYTGTVLIATSTENSRTVYSTASGSTTPSFVSHSATATTRLSDNSVVGKELPLVLGFLDTDVYLFWTRSGTSPDWDGRDGSGLIKYISAATSNLNSWTSEATIIDTPSGDWSAAQVSVFTGTTLGLGIFGGFVAPDAGENGQFIVIPHPADIPDVTKSVSDTLALTDGSGVPGVHNPTFTPFGTLTADCGNPPVGTVGGAYVHRPTVMLGSIGLPPVYDSNGTLVWQADWSALPPGLIWDENPASPTFGHIVGIPTAAGDFPFSFTVTSSDGQSVTKDCSISIEGGSDSGGGGGNGGNGGDGTHGGGTPPPAAPGQGSGMGNCIFEFYEMQRPEDVEVLPVPKKYDQLGPMRFDKIGKIFGFRVRLIVNGTTTVMPFAIYGDNSQSSPQLAAPLFSWQFDVQPGFDNVYEIMLPKSINTDVFRLTLGPISDSFHRYDVLVKVHISGMKGQARWLPIR